MTFYHDNRLTMMGSDSVPLDFHYAPSSSKRTYSEMSHGEMIPPSWLDFHNVGLVSSSGGESYQNNDFQDGNLSNVYDPVEEGSYEAQDTVLDAAMAQDLAQDNNNTAVAMPGASANTGNESGGCTDTSVKQEEDEYLVSLTPYGGSEYDESEYDGRRRSKVPKLNKDGVPRKPRQPRPKLLKWDDNDWKNVALGLVWACGENGIQIPFDQASQVVSESCTAGALQQALLKLRGKQIAEGFQIPSLRMAWTRKNKSGTLSTSSANSNLSQGTDKNLLPKKRPTRFLGTQALVVTLRRAYVDADRVHLAFPHNLTNAQRANEAPQPTIEATQQVNRAPQQVNEVVQRATAALPVSSMATLNQGFLQATGGLAFQQSLGYPVVATNSNAGASYPVSEPQTSPGFGRFDTLGMPMTPARLRTVYEENEDESPMHGLPLSPTPHAFGAARGHRRNAPSILNMESLSGATAPSQASYSASATVSMLGGQTKFGDSNDKWDKGVVDKNGMIDADFANPEPNWKATTYMNGFGMNYRRDGPGSGGNGNGTSGNAGSLGSNSHGGGLAH